MYIHVFLFNAIYVYKHERFRRTLIYLNVLNVTFVTFGTIAQSVCPAAINEKRNAGNEQNTIFPGDDA